MNNKLPEHQDNTHRGLKKINITVDPATNLKIHLLLIPAEPKNDGVNIKCLIYNIQSVSSDLVYLYVQGMFTEFNAEYLRLDMSLIELSQHHNERIIGLF